MKIELVRVVPVVTAGAYSANDVVGGTLTFGTGAAILRAVTITDLAKQAGAYQLVFFKSSPTDILDNGVFDIADADHAKMVGAIHITDTVGADRFDLSDSKLYCRQGLILPFDSGTLYAFLIALGTPTYAATTDVAITLHLEKT